MSRRIVDLSVPLETGIASDPDPMLPGITYLDHKATAAQVCAVFPGLKPADLPGGEGWAPRRGSPGQWRFSTSDTRVHRRDPLESFADEVHEVIARKAYDEAVTRPGVVAGLDRGIQSLTI